MKSFVFFVLFHSGCLLSVDASNQFTKYQKPEEAFTFGESESPINYQNHSSTVMCMLSLDAHWRQGKAHYNVDMNDSTRNISFDGNLCTHVVYNKFHIDSTNGRIIPKDYEFIKKFNNFIRAKFPHLKSLINLDLKWTSFEEGYRILSGLLSTNASRSKLVSDLKGTVRDLNLSGLYFSRKVNINYPDPRNIILDFAKSLKHEFEKYGLLLATEIPGYSISNLNKNYNQVGQISRIFDIVVVQGWGYDNLYQGKKGHIAPLFVTEENERGSIRKTLNHIITNMNVQPNKLVLGIFLLGAPRLRVNGGISKDILKGPMLLYNFWLYFETCSSALDKSQSWNVFWDEIAKAPFMEDDQRLISFESPKSVYEKTVFANKLGLLGVMNANTEADDFNGICTKTKNPQLKAINTAFADSEICKQFKARIKDVHLNSKENITFERTIQSVTAKEKVTITCIVQTPSKRNVSWIKVDGNNVESPIESGQNSNVIIHPSDYNHTWCLPYITIKSTLEIEKMDIQNSGKYICSVGGDNKAESVLHCKDNCEEKKEQGSSWLWWWVLLGIGVFAVVGVTISICLWGFKRKNEGLSATEILLFQNGYFKKRRNIENSPEDCINPEELKYDHDSYEISEDNFEIDTEKVLGSGNVGIVYKGSVKGNFVAVKTTKPGGDKRCLKSLLQEVKILIHIGKHQNIVSFMGANTKLLSQGIVYLFVEYGPLGSLDTFLKKSRKNFTHSYINVEINKEANGYRAYNYCTTSSDLAKWAYQIIKALQHLRIKKVIHGDVATRNVLVFDVNVVKLTDFGLSRKRYNYSNYIKKSEDPLPWRWLAIESLRDTTFSFQSDVWSFGVTLWEIFSLAETPYPGMTCCLDFIKQLETGLRMDIPKYATQPIYNLMKKCWREEPEQRPKINDIEQDFLAILKTNHSS